MRADDFIIIDQYSDPNCTKPALTLTIKNNKTACQNILNNYFKVDCKYGQATAFVYSNQGCSGQMSAINLKPQGVCGTDLSGDSGKSAKYVCGGASGFHASKVAGLFALMSLLSGYLALH